MIVKFLLKKSGETPLINKDKNVNYFLSSIPKSLYKNSFICYSALNSFSIYCIIFRHLYLVIYGVKLGDHLIITCKA